MSDIFVAFIDILGFRDLVATTAHEVILQKLELLSERIEHIKTTTAKQEVKQGFESQELIPYIFSDSVVIFTKDDSIGSCKLLLFACQDLFYHCFKIQLPIKGSISYGRMTVDLNKSIFFGKPLINAFSLHEELKYYGLILHHSAETKINEIDNDKYDLAELLYKGKTPTKSGSIIYTNLKYKKAKDESLDLDKVINSFYSYVSGEPRVYVDNTLDMLNRMKE